MKSIQVQTVNYQTRIKMKQTERRNKRKDSTQYHIPNKSSIQIQTVNLQRSEISDWIWIQILNMSAF